MDVELLQVEALQLQLLGDARVVVFLLGVVVSDLSEAMIDLPVIVIVESISLVHLSDLRDNEVRLLRIRDPLVVRVERSRPLLMPVLLLRIPEAEDVPEVALRYDLGVLGGMIKFNSLAFYVLFVQLNHIVINA